MRIDAMERWRETAAVLPGVKQGRRYPEHLRVAAMELATAAVSSGMRLAEVSQRLGVPEVTLKAWHRRRALVPVEIVEDRPVSVRVHLGGGHADLSIDQFAAVLRRLA